jgi:hypothetical protein
VDVYDRSFSSKLKTEVAHPDWPKSAEYNTFMAAVMANQLDANCDEHLRAALYSHTTHRDLVKPENMHQWNLVAIYDALQEIERDPVSAVPMKGRCEEVIFPFFLGASGVGCASTPLFIHRGMPRG